MKDLETIKDMKKTLVKHLSHEIEGNIQAVDTHEAGMVVDMIKDLAETEKACIEACYYKLLMKKMCEYEFEEDDNLEEDEDFEEFFKNMRMGYPSGGGGRGGSSGGGRGGSSGGGRGGSSGGGRGGSSGGRGGSSSGGRGGSSGGRGGSGGSSGGSSGGGSSSGGGGRSGYTPMMPPFYDGGMDGMTDAWGRDGQSRNTYDEYQDARRFFSENRSPEAKREMDERGKKHVMESVETIREVWSDADPEAKKKIKADMARLVNEMNV
ncbi:MAG: hypothetical protein [Chaetfec virus UA24_144]|nr:MAG: hypothetical protein [Chaetfec virus UA24_144]